MIRVYHMIHDDANPWFVGRDRSPDGSAATQTPGERVALVSLGHHLKVNLRWVETHPGWSFGTWETTDLSLGLVTLLVSKHKLGYSFLTPYP